MKANELRIGNLVYSELDYCDIAITGILQTDVYSKSGFAPVEYYKPIPLDEEWILKFGFIKVSDNYIIIESYHYQNNECWIYLLPDSFEFELNTMDERHNLGKQFKYVHQLQNLYFALTGEELTIKS